MVKKLSVNIDYSNEYSFVGISCHLKDYRLCYQLNKVLGFKLKRLEDFNQLDENQNTHPYSIYYYHYPDGHSDFCLISNHHAEMKLLPSLKQFDYFLLFERSLSDSQKASLLQKIKKVPNMIMAYEIDYSKINRINYLITELELQFLESIPRFKKLDFVS